MHTTVFGSTPNGTFCTWTGLNSSMASFCAARDAALSFSACAFSAALRFSVGLPLVLVLRFIRSICFCVWAPFLFFIPKVLSSATFGALGWFLVSFFGGMLAVCDWAYSRFREGIFEGICDNISTPFGFVCFC